MAILVRLLVHPLVPLGRRRPLLLGHEVIQKPITLIHFRFNFNWNFFVRANDLLWHLYGIKEFW